MKQFKPFDKVLYRIFSDTCWIPSFYQFQESGKHFVIDEDIDILDKNILPYKGNEHLVGTTDEPEEEITLKDGQLIVCSNNFDTLKYGKGVITGFVHPYDGALKTNIGIVYKYCIPMSKYNPNNLEETSKWILTVKNNKLVKANK